MNHKLLGVRAHHGYVLQVEGQDVAAGSKFRSNKFKGVIDAFCTGLGKLVEGNALQSLPCVPR